MRQLLLMKANATSEMMSQRFCMRVYLFICVRVCVRLERAPRTRSKSCSSSWMSEAAGQGVCYGVLGLKQARPSGAPPP